MKTKERIIDLSDIKDNELDKTASFTDLMTRSERKKREIEKKKEKINKFDKNIETSNTIENTELENISNVETTEEKLNQTKKFEDLTQTLNKEININEEDIEEDIKSKYGSGIIIVMGLFLIISTSLCIYSILFTSILDKNKYLYIDIMSLSGMYFLFCLSLISGKKFSKFITILNYIAFIIFISFNILLKLNYIK